ncbi:MAG: glycosyltransferase family 39 protein [Euryarchaeota archaeon]|nr:glycosyltransferase family 39 protein [Euryarchaeota archaeon]
MSNIGDSLIRVRRRLSKVSRQTWFLLGIIVVFAVGIRSIPAYIYPAWGSDLGIYYSLTNSFINTGEIFSNYSGWGESYQYFPVLYVITAIPCLLTGLSPEFWIGKIAPIFGGLTVIWIYLIARNVGFGRRSSLLAALLLAVNSIHIYQTSHAAPMTLGHFFLLASLYYFTKEERRKRDWALLVVCTLLLIGSHHLSSYMLLITLPFMLAFSEGNRWKEDAVYIVFAATAVFAYWGTVANYSMASFIQSATGLPWFSVIPMYVGVVAAALLIRKYAVPPFMKWLKEPVGYWLDVWKLVAAMSTMTAIIITLYAFRSPAIVIAPTLWFVIWSLPLFALVSFAAPGAWQTATKRQGGLVIGWLIAILGSTLLAIALQSNILRAERHLEYLMEPLSLCAALGMVRLIYPLLQEELIVKYTSAETVTVRTGAPAYRPALTLSSSEDRAGFTFVSPSNQGRELHLEVTREHRRVNPRKLLPTFVIVILFGCALASYQTIHEAGYTEVISEADLKAMEWLQHDGPLNYTSRNFTVATDHRLGTLVENLGFNSTFEDGWMIWNATAWTDCWSQLNGTANKSRVGYVLIDNVMRDPEMGVQVFELNRTVMRNETYDMFKRSDSRPFERKWSYRESNDPDANWAEIYIVHWEWIENYTAPI